MGTIKDKNGMYPTEAEDIKKWQEYTELQKKKKNLHDPDNHGFITHLEPDMLEWSGPKETSLRTKLVEVMEFQLS